MVHFLKTLLQLQNTARVRAGVNTPSPHPPLQLFLVSLALSQKWFRDFFFKKKKALLSVFPALSVSYFFRIREKADTQETAKLGSV